eukprot:5598690-Pyramimonas_sp.AAC.1
MQLKMTRNRPAQVYGAHLSAVGDGQHCQHLGQGEGALDLLRAEPFRSHGASQVLCQDGRSRE